MRRTLTAGLVLGLLALPTMAGAQSAADEQRAAGLAAYWRLHFQEAQKHFQAAVDADPTSAASHYYLAYTVYKIAEPKRPNDPGKQEAAALFAKAYEIDPFFTPGWGLHGRP